MIQTQIEKDENVRCFFQKGLPELKHQEFAENVKNVSDYTWVHFEGRPNIDEIKKMLEFIHCGASFKKGKMDEITEIIDKRGPTAQS